jgi:integrase
MAAIKGHPGLYWRGSVIWAQWWCKRCPEHLYGGRHRKSCETDRIKDAADKREEFKKETSPKKAIIDIDEITVDYLLDRYLNKTDIQKSTLTGYEDLCRKHLRPSLGNHLATDLIYDDSILTKFTNKKLNLDKIKDQPTYSPAYVNSMRTLLKASFANAHKALSGMTPKIERLPNHAKRTGFYTDAEIKTLLNKLPDSLARAIGVLNLTGWRLSEVFSRKKGHCIMPKNEAGKLSLEQGETKNNEGRDFPIIKGRQLEAVLKEQIEATRKLERNKGIVIQSLFHDDDGLPWMNYYESRGAWKPTRTFRNIWKLALKEAGLANRLLHDFRRTQVRRYSKSKVDDAVGMSLTGHRSLRIYHDYKAVGVADRIKAIEKTEAKAVGQE